MKNWRESVSGRRWSVSGLDPVRGWTKLDQSIIVYRVQCGDVFGGSEPRRIVKQVQDFNGYVPGGIYTIELDLLNRSLVMWINNKKIILDGKIGDFQFSPIVILYPGAPEITLL